MKTARTASRNVAGKAKSFGFDGTQYYIYDEISSDGSPWSCVVIEDKPARYVPFLKKLVTDGLCCRACVLPHTPASADLLAKGTATFTDDEDDGIAVSVKLPSVRLCVAFLDVHTASNSAKGGEFLRMLNEKGGFKGKLVFATQYGRDGLPAAMKGVECTYAVIDLPKGFTEGLPEEIRGKMEASIARSKDEVGANVFIKAGEGYFLFDKASGEEVWVATDKGVLVAHKLISEQCREIGTEDLCRSAGINMESSMQVWKSKYAAVRFSEERGDDTQPESEGDASSYESDLQKDTCEGRRSTPSEAKALSAKIQFYQTQVTEKKKQVKDIEFQIGKTKSEIDALETTRFTEEELESLEADAPLELSEPGNPAVVEKAEKLIAAKRQAQEKLAIQLTELEQRLQEAKTARKESDKLLTEARNDFNWTVRRIPPKSPARADTERRLTDFRRTLEALGKPNLADLFRKTLHIGSLRSCYNNSELKWVVD